MTISLKVPSAIIGYGGAFLVYLTGGLDTLFSAFLVFVIADWALAIIAAKLNGKPVSRLRAVRGFWRLAAYLILVVVAHQFDAASPHLIGFSTLDRVRNALLVGLAGGELVSIIRNAGFCGCAAPGWLSVFVRGMSGERKEGGTDGR